MTPSNDIQIAAGPACPGCGTCMQQEHFENLTGGEVGVEICYPCCVIWFDSLESAQLAPGGVIELFKKIHVHRADVRHALPERMACPRCKQTLKLTNDIVKSGPVSYHRCVQNHGRLTSFFHFLREKEFVRNLTLRELSSIKERLAEVRCSGCGGPIDITQDTACGHCRAPLSVLDARAVEKTLEALAERKARGKDPVRIAVAMKEALLDDPARARARERRLAKAPDTDSWAQTTDLVLSGISAMVKAFRK